MHGVKLSASFFVGVNGGLGMQIRDSGAGLIRRVPQPALRARSTIVECFDVFVSVAADTYKRMSRLVGVCDCDGGGCVRCPRPRLPGRL